MIRTPRVWSDLAVDADHRTIARDRVGPYHVVTLRRSTDLCVVYETRVIREGTNGACLQRETYASESAARAGHIRYISQTRTVWLRETLLWTGLGALAIASIAVACSMVSG